MNSNISQIILIAVILVAVAGVFFVASACGGAGMQALLGMNMKGCLSAVTHPLLAFVIIFAAIVVSVGVLALLPIRASLVSIPDPRFVVRAEAIKYKSLNNKQRDSKPLFVHKSATQGASRKRGDSDDSN